MSRFGSVFFILPLCLPISAFAQQSAAPGAVLKPPAMAAPQTSALSPRAGAESAPKHAEGQIKLDVVVTDKSGKPVSGLKLEDFELLDNKLPATILSFQAFDAIVQKADSPVEVILVIDTVNMPFTQVSNVRQEIAKFLLENGGHLAEPVSLMVLTNTGVSAGRQPSSDGIELAAEVARQDVRLRSETRAAGVYGAIDRFQLSIKMLTNIAASEAKKPGRKLLIWAGSGWPMLTGPNIETSAKGQREIFNTIVQLSDKLRQARISVYSVAQGLPGMGTFLYQDYVKGEKTAEKADSGNLSLKVLAVQSGGLAVAPDNDLAAQIGRCVQDATAFYTLSFDPPRADRANEYHDLKVQISKPGLSARTNTGYYNQVDFSGLSAPVLKIDSDPPVAAAHPVTVDELEDMLKGVQGMPDADAARRLSGLELTERLNNVKLSSWKPRLPGTKTWAALVALADASIFLGPPAQETPGLAPPDVDAQRQMLSRTADYLSKTIPRLPNLFASRTTVLYDDSRQAGATENDARSWRMTDSSTATVLYRDGREVVDLDGVKAKKQDAKEKGLVTRGTFGVILYTVFMEAVHGGLSWSHWEQGGTGPEGVYGFAVREDSSQYDVDFPDPLGTYESKHIKQRTGYRGEIAVDPASGAILRLTVKADLDRSSPLVRADIMVEYGPVEIGGKTYICPLKSVSISRLESPLKQELTQLSDATFGSYHLFRTESRILEDNP